MQNGTCGKHLGPLGSGSFRGLFMVLVWICHMINPICEVVAGLLVGASGHLESNKTRTKIVTLCLPYHGIGIKWEDQCNGYCTGMSCYVKVVCLGKKQLSLVSQICRKSYPVTLQRKLPQMQILWQHLSHLVALLHWGPWGCLVWFTDLSAKFKADGL